MRVAIDATPLTLTSGGLARYTRELSLALAGAFPNDQFVLVSDQPFDLPRGAPANLTAGKGPRNALERRWWLWGLHREMERLAAEVFHGTDFAVPYIPRRPSVLTLHDLSPWMDPGWHHAADRVRGRTPLLIELGCATVILTDTEAVRRQAIEHFRIHPSRVVAVPLGGLPQTACQRQRKGRAVLPVRGDARAAEEYRGAAGGLARGAAAAPGGPRAGRRRGEDSPAGARSRACVLGRGPRRGTAEALLGRAGAGLSLSL